MAKIFIVNKWSSKKRNPFIASNIEFVAFLLNLTSSSGLNSTLRKARCQRKEAFIDKACMPHSLKIVLGDAEIPEHRKYM